MEEEKFIRIPLVRQRWLSWTCEIDICHHEKTMPIRLGRTPARPEQGRSVAAMGASAVMLAILAASCLAAEGAAARRPAAPRRLCPHQRLKYNCRDCGGGGICEHKRVRSTCIDCGGGGICEHKRRRSRCIDCGGSEICEHKRQRSSCKDCGGTERVDHTSATTSAARGRTLSPASLLVSAGVHDKSSKILFPLFPHGVSVVGRQA